MYEHIAQTDVADVQEEAVAILTERLRCCLIDDHSEYEADYWME